MKCVTYKKGFKYQLAKNFELETGIQISSEEGLSIDGYIVMTADGKLIISKGYVWDGPSGPTIDTLNFMRGSLVHDALYQLMREKLLDYKTDRKDADDLLRVMCKDDGMSSIRAWWVYKAVRWWGEKSAKPPNENNVVLAPKECRED